MKQKAILLSISLLILVISCKKEDTLVSPKLIFNNPLQTKTDSLVHEAFLKYQNNLSTIGVSIGLHINGLTYFYGYGETKKGSGEIPKQNTFYEIGSITKTFTTIASLCMLAENGQTIENPIRPYLPNNLPTLARDGVEVNFKHIMTHTSGLGYFPDNIGALQYLNVGKAFEKYDRNKLYTYLLNAPLRHKPFTTFEYSNSAMGVLGTILELNYNKKYSSIIKEKVFDPLQLNDTKTDMSETDLNRWAKGYSKGKETPYWNSLNAMDGAGVIKSTASDLIKYGLANINPPNTQLGNAINQSHQITFLPFTDGVNYQINGRLGWFQFIDNNLPNESFIWHSGGTGGFSSELFINKSKSCIVVLLYNSDDGGKAMEDFKLELLKIVCM
jgi:CubicO group peptidase (beta-lactamase class C family)